MYQHYIDYVESIVKSNHLDNFKSNNIYRDILEHVSHSIGEEYYRLLITKHNLDKNLIEKFCLENDKLGSPVKYVIGDLSFPVSPTSLRYLDHAVHTLNYIQTLKLQTVNIVEIGCGYGGLLLALDYMSKLYGITINSYSCIDIDVVTKLQSLYISNYDISFPVTFHSASTFGHSVKNDNLFLISMYCFSEIETVNQQRYIETIMKRISNGIIMWNHCDIFDFGKKIISIEDEKPLTGHNNKLVLF
jgi:hypothetical protein